MGQSVQFIALAITKWHLMGIISYLIHKHGSIDGLDITIIIIPHPKDGYIIDFSDIIQLPNIKVLKRDNIPLKSTRFLNCMLFLFNLSLTSKTAIDFIVPRKLSLKILLNYLDSRSFISNKIHFTCIDEGIGTYFSHKVWKRCSIMENNYNLSIIIKGFLSTLLNKASNASSWNLMSKGTYLTPNYEAAKCYKTAITLLMEKSASNLSFDRNIFFSKNKIAIFLSQPWSEDGQLDLNEELNLLKSVFTLLSTKGYSIFVKPHPRENPHKFSNTGFNKITLLPLSMPAEYIFIFLRQQDITVGYNSTALLTSKVIFNVPAYSAIQMVRLDNSDNMISHSFAEFELLLNDLIKPIQRL